jgi:hypothetical protein
MAAVNPDFVQVLSDPFRKLRFSFGVTKNSLPKVPPKIKMRHDLEHLIHKKEKTRAVIDRIDWMAKYLEAHKLGLALSQQEALQAREKELPMKGLDLNCVAMPMEWI